MRRKNTGGTAANPKVTPGLPVTVADEQLRRRATRWHWGVPATQGVLWEDPDFPERMVEIGRLAELKIQPIGESKQITIPIPHEYWNDFPQDGTRAKVNRGADQENRKAQAHLVFDADHPIQRIYICLPPAVMKLFAPAYVQSESMMLSDLAERVGGKQGKKRDYPAVRVCPLGLLHHVVYFSEKQGDQNPGNVRSLYDHHMGEEGGNPPALAVDKHGRLWLAGGSYKCGLPGIDH